MSATPRHETGRNSAFPVYGRVRLDAWCHGCPRSAAGEQEEGRRRPPNLFSCLPLGKPCPQHSGGVVGSSARITPVPVPGSPRLGCGHSHLVGGRGRGMSGSSSCSSSSSSSSFDSDPLQRQCCGPVAEAGGRTTHCSGRDDRRVKCRACPRREEDRADEAHRHEKDPDHAYNRGPPDWSK